MRDEFTVPSQRPQEDRLFGSEKKGRGGGEKKEKKIQCQMSCFCEQDSQVNESNTHLVTL